MVGIKPTFAPLPLCFLVCAAEVENIFRQFPKERDETWTFDRCLFEYQTELRRPADGGQIAFQTGSSVWVRSCRRGSIFTPGYFFFFLPPGEWMCKPLTHITVIITSLWYSSAHSRKKNQKTHSVGSQHPDFGLEFVFSSKPHLQGDKLFFFCFLPHHSE